MRRHTVTKLLPYTPDQLFSLVGDIERYPEFVPWLTHMRTWNETTIAPGVTGVDAEAAVGFSFLREKFATRVQRDGNRHEILVALLYGPFKTLRNHWRFVPAPGGSEVHFAIDFEFKAFLLDRMLAANMDRAVTKLIDCFEGRAQALYGPAAPRPGGSASASS